MIDNDIFQGIRVVELAQWVFVPIAGTLLADWGADVIRIEHPDGDPYRALSTQRIGADGDLVNMNMALTNRGKRSLAVNLKSEKGLEILHSLLETADVLLTNFRPDALVRLGLTVNEVRKRYPKLIFARGSGYGVRGPDANLAGYDASAFFARGGLADALTPPERDYPISQRGAMGDRNGGMAIAFGIAGALLKKERTGRGSVVDVSLLATAMWTLSSDMLTVIQGHDIPRPVSHYDMPNPLTNTYRTSDGRFIQLMFLQADRYWADFCREFDLIDMVDDERFADLAARRANAKACIERLDEAFAKRSFAECKALLGRIDAPWAPIQKVEELLDDPQVIANGYIGEYDPGDGGPSYRLPTVPVQFDERPPAIRRAPELGEHTEALLMEMGYGWDDIVGLQAEKIIP